MKKSIINVFLNVYGATQIETLIIAMDRLLKTTQGNAPKSTVRYKNISPEKIVSIADERSPKKMKNKNKHGGGKRIEELSSYDYLGSILTIRKGTGCTKKEGRKLARDKNVCAYRARGPNMLISAIGLPRNL